MIERFDEYLATLTQVQQEQALQLAHNIGYYVGVVLVAALGVYAIILGVNLVFILIRQATNAGGVGGGATDEDWYSYSTWDSTTRTQHLMYSDNVVVSTTLSRGQPTRL